MTRTTIEVEALRDLLDRGQPVTVLDIRRSAEHAEWAIPGSVHVEAYDALKAGDPNALADVDLPREGPIVTVCGAGKTSVIAAEELRARGFQALSLAGGMKAWSLAWNIAEVPVKGSRARVVQVRRTGKGCLSYIVESEGKAIVIDAALEPEVYLEIVDDRGWKITGVLETHIHADHLSRSRRLAEQDGEVTLYLPEQDRVSFAFTPVRDKDVVEVGAAKLKALSTPGHTPESTSYLLDDQALFTGDTLFVDGVGRPDLEASPEEKRSRAQALYHSLRHLLDLPPETLILPGHTSEPVPFDEEPISGTIAQVREGIEALGASEDVFVKRILEHLPPTPSNHHRIVKLNEAGGLPEEELTELEAGANRCAVG
jgi:glyoxylase-like metal-dependent hydrolase (beta-lactamase superfamily II)/rhodanese-related sulfurtransferase